MAQSLVDGRESGDIVLACGGMPKSGTVLIVDVDRNHYSNNTDIVCPGLPARTRRAAGIGPVAGIGCVLHTGLLARNALVPGNGQYFGAAKVPDISHHLDGTPEHVLAQHTA